MEERYRLRVADEVVGYERHDGARTLWSRDGRTWSGARVPHEERDRWSGVPDVYEHDVVSWRGRTCEVLDEGAFVLRDLDTSERLPLAANATLRVIGYRLAPEPVAG